MAEREELPEDLTAAHAVVAAAFATLPHRRLESTSAPPMISIADEMESVRQYLERAIRRPEDDPVFGVDLVDLLGVGKSVRFEELDKEDKVRVEKDEVLVDSRYFPAAACRADSHDARLAICLLYMLHELIHVAQGIGKKEVVTRLREAETDAEMTLLEIDLSADHAAACLANRAVPRWTLSWLKDLVGKTLADYPFTKDHKPVARKRKAVRLVSLRLDYLLRETRVPLVSSSPMAGYVFARYGDEGGPFIVLRSGPPIAIIKEWRISTEDAGALAAAADEAHLHEGGIEKIDALLRRIIEFEARP